MKISSLFNSFKDGNDPVDSKLFNAFLDERDNVARQLHENNESRGNLITVNGKAVFEGYSNNQQDVLMGAFYNVYTGRNQKAFKTTNVFPGMPLPNWTITWDGLSRIPAIKKRFRSITLRHTYRSTYNINNFSNNILFNPDGTTQNVKWAVQTGTTAPNFVSYYTIGSIRVAHNFIGINTANSQLAVFY